MTFIMFYRTYFKSFMIITKQTIFIFYQKILKFLIHQLKLCLIVLKGHLKNKLILTLEPLIKFLVLF